MFINIVKKDVMRLLSKVLVILQNVPYPTTFLVTHWQDDMYSKMAYSYVTTGGQGEAYDVLAEDIERKVYFAGEVS